LVVGNCGGRESVWMRPGLSGAVTCVDKSARAMWSAVPPVQ